MLILWQLETRSKQFLPRLGAEIESIAISPDQSMYALGQKDNCIRVISATDMTIKHAISGVKAAHLDRNMYPMSIGILADPISGNLVMNGSPGALQYFDLEANRSVSDVLNLLT